MAIAYSSKPIIEDSEIKGGFHSVNNISERNTISSLRRKEGMFVFQSDTDTLWTLNADLTTWTSIPKDGYAINIAALKAINLQNVDNGTSIYLTSVRDYFVYNAANTDTDDGITIIQPTTGAGRWIRNCYTDLVWILQTTWYIDPTNGNDENNGLTNTTAIKTHKEYERRTGAESPSPVADTNIYILNPFPYDPLIHFQRRVPTGLTVTRIMYHGSQTVSHTGTFSSVTARSASTNVQCTVKDGTFNWTPYVGKMIRVAARSAYAFIIKDLGGGSARLSTWATGDVFSMAEVTTVTTGDTYEIVELQSFGGIFIASPDINTSSLSFYDFQFDDFQIGMFCEMVFVRCNFADAVNQTYFTDACRIILFLCRVAAGIELQDGCAGFGYYTVGGGRWAAGKFSRCVLEQHVQQGGYIRAYQRGYMEVVSTALYDNVLAGGGAIQIDGDGIIMIQGIIYGEVGTSVISVINGKSGKLQWAGADSTAFTALFKATGGSVNHITIQNATHTTSFTFTQMAASGGYIQVLPYFAMFGDVASAPNGGITVEGGVYVWMINKSGAPSVKGSIAAADTGVNYAFKLTAADAYDAIGAVYDSGIADATWCRVVIGGIADVLLQDSTASTRAYWVRTSTTAAGRADATNAAPPGLVLQHFAEIGHCLESKNAGTDVLARCLLHFN